jgi:hypothetical protein
MRLSLLKAAYVAVDECCEEGNPEFARDDKGEGGAHLNSGYRGMDRAAAGYPRFSSPWVSLRLMTPPVGGCDFIDFREKSSSFERNCHPDRSAAEWSDCCFLLSIRSDGF